MAAVVQLRTKTIRDIPRYEQDGQVIWAADIPRETAAIASLGTATLPRQPAAMRPTIWIELRKPHLTRPPEPPESVRPWVRREQLDDSSLEYPESSSVTQQDVRLHATVTVARSAPP